MALAVTACKGERQASSRASAASASRGPDQIILRIPARGGTARAYVHPRLDSAVWAASGAPPVDRVLGFDPDEGAVALVDDKGLPRRVDLRATEVRLASRDKLSSLASADGTEIYGINAKGDVVRLTPAGDWTFEPPSPARWVFPQSNGTVIVAGDQGANTHLWLIRPTDEDILATASLPLVSRGARAQAGDRLYFTVDSGLIGVRTRDLSPVKSVRLGGPAQAMVPTPSGDRLYVALRGQKRLEVVDRYTEALAQSVELPGPVSDLRMDPLGQSILARPAGGGDSAWVIAVGTDRVAGTIRGEWRNDLPAFAPGRMIAAVRRGDVVLINGETLADTQTIERGANDFWYFFAWNGFRPRAAGLDRPVTFETPESVVVQDSPVVPRSDSLRPPPIRDTSRSMIQPPPSVSPRAGGYLVSFAAVLSAAKAAETAAGITVGGTRPRVATTRSGTTTIYRVVLGPYPTRDEAERVGRESGRQYWVYEDRQ